MSDKNQEKYPYSLEAQRKSFKDSFLPTLIECGFTVKTESKKRIELHSKTKQELIIKISFSEDIRDIHCDGFYISVLRGEEIVAGTTEKNIDQPSVFKDWLKVLVNDKA